MIAPLPVFGFVVNGIIFDFHLTGIKIPLEVGAILLGIPQAELQKTPQHKFFPLGAVIGKFDLLHLPVKIKGDKIENMGPQTVLFSADGGIAQPVPAFVTVQIGFYGLPSRRPDRSVIIDIEIFSARVHRNIIIAITGDSSV